MPKTKSSLDAWRRRFDREEKSYKDILTWDRWKDWDRNTAPDSSAEGNFTLALSILYSGRGKKYSTQFLQMALDCVQRAEDENKFQSSLCEFDFPHNLGNAMRVKQYAQALQSGVFSNQELLESAKNHEKFCRGRKRWGDIERAHILAAARMALIAGARDRAGQLLKSTRPFRNREAEQSLWKKIAALKSDLPLKDCGLLAEFDAVFDPVRLPNYWPKFYMELLLTRFEMAVIRYKYFVSRDGTIAWSRAIKQVTR